MGGVLMKARKAILFLFIGSFLVFVALMFYVCSTTNIKYLIVESVESGTTIIPRFVSEFFLFNFRGGEEDIAELKNNGGLNYITSALVNSKFSKDKKAKYLKYFISKGCGVNDVFSFDGFRPLHGAALSGDAEITVLLLANGADPLLKTESPKGLDTFKNMTPLEVAERAQIKSQIDYSKVIDILRKAEKIRRQAARIR